MLTFVDLYAWQCGSVFAGMLQNKSRKLKKYQKESLCIFLLKLLSYKMTIGRFCCNVLSLSLVVVLQEGAAVLAVLAVLLYDEWSNGTPTTIASPVK